MLGGTKIGKLICNKKWGGASLVYPLEIFEITFSLEFVNKKIVELCSLEFTKIFKSFTCNTPNKLTIYWRSPMKKAYHFFS